LKRGEGHFSVVKDPLRPFIVTARGIEVVAVGTAFNLRLDDAGAVEVLVTEGRVQVAEAAPTGVDWRERRVERPLIPLLEARQRAIVTVGMIRSTPEIATLTAGEIERVLAWQHRLLDFTAVPLSEVVAEFNRRNVVQLVIIDPELASVRISASFRSDNIDGFLRLLEMGFGARAERRGEFEVLLRAAR
jgi:transmembrane sensor